MKQNDLVEGLDPTPSDQLSQSMLLQMLREATPEDHIAWLLIQETEPDLDQNPRYARYLWLKTGENFLRRYDSDSETWVPLTVGDIPSAIISPGSITLEQLFTPSAGNERKLLRVNAASNGWELWTFSLDDGSVSIAKLKVESGKNLQYLRQKEDGSGFELAPINFTPEENSIELSALQKTEPTDKFYFLVQSPSAGISMVEGSKAMIIAWIQEGAIRTSKLEGPGQDGTWILKSVDQVVGWYSESRQVTQAKVFTTNFAIESGAAVKSVEHGLGSTPDIDVMLLCAPDGDGDYIAGDNVSAWSLLSDTGSNYFPAIQVRRSATHIYVDYPAGDLILRSKNPSSGYFTIDRSRWSIAVVARTFPTINV